MGRIGFLSELLYESRIYHQPGWNRVSSELVFEYAVEVHPDGTGSRLSGIQICWCCEQKLTRIGLDFV